VSDAAVGQVFEPASDPRVEVLRIGRGGHPVLVIDGLLDGASSLVDHAADTAVLAPVKSAANFYPGVRAPAPAGYVQALVRALRPWLAETFAAPVDGRARITSALSMATLPAAEANLAQRLPHIDTTEPNQLAILHFLCGPPHAGTAFYRHRATGLEVIDAERGPAYFAALRDQMAANSRPARYITGSDALFEQTAAVAPAFNRIIVYASNLLHAGMLPDQPISADPRTGRLTVNTFFRFAPR